MKTTSIYSLCEPGTKIIRYIGKTDGTLKARLRLHLINRGEKNYRANWVESLRRIGKTPDLYLLCKVPRYDFARYERAFIAVARRHGMRLTNATDGGDGSPGIKQSPASRHKKSIALLGKKVSEETRQKMRVSAITRSRKSGLTSQVKGSNNTSGFIGVSLDQNKYRVCICGKTIGRFRKIEDAVFARSLTVANLI